MDQLIEDLCSPACAGRRPGTAGGDRARRIVLSALRDAGLDPHEQRVPACGGANVLARIPGDVARYVVVAAHFDHLGSSGETFFAGADDNAAAVAVLVETARALAGERSGRGIIIAAFDGEEPPAFLSGSAEFVRRNRDPIDFMVCMDLVGHRLGPAEVPDEVGASLFALGSERCPGTTELVSALKRTEAGVVVRPIDAEIIPPLSDYGPFWDQDVPFLFLSAARSRVYHTPEDTPDKLDRPKIAATARWLTRFVRATRQRDALVFRNARLDRTTLDELDEILGALAPLTREAAAARQLIAQLRQRCNAKGELPQRARAELTKLLGALEQRLE